MSRRWQEFEKSNLEKVKELEKAAGEGKRKNVLSVTERKRPLYAIVESLTTVFLLIVLIMG